MLVRDGSDGLEVFMLQRTAAASFAPGVYVFPGGGVDAADSGAAVDEICDGLTDAEASDRLGIGSGGLAYWVAAIRECFEEAGVLLARPSTGGPALRFDDDATIARFDAARHAVHRGELAIVDMCSDEGLRLMTDAIHYVAHWVTPRGETKRYDTRFFLARAPQAQTPLHDDAETVASAWARPADALARFEAGQFALMPPTVSSLRFLADFATADAAVEAAAVMDRPEAILPRLRGWIDGRPDVLLPWEPGYDELT